MPKRKQGGVPVTIRALLQRINRRLKADEQMVKATRGARALQEFGDYYQLDYNHNHILATHVDPETLGRELGVLSAFESVVDDRGAK